jgi:hypothetical protein
MVGRLARFAVNNAVGLLALFVALGGVSYAASGGFTSGGRLQACVGQNGALTLLKSGKKCRRGQQKVVWNQTGPRGPAGAGGAAGLNAGATLAAKVASAETALTAGDALSLGGIPASGYTRSDCASTTGQIKGFVLIPEKAGTSFEPAGVSYNCSGGAVTVRKEQFTGGVYNVKFENNPSEIAVTTVNAHEDDTASAVRTGLGEWNVYVNFAPGTGEREATISMILP